jgi:outer membrane protein assembly factor BamB/subtilisin family serine protease
MASQAVLFTASPVPIIRSLRFSLTVGAVLAAVTWFASTALPAERRPLTVKELAQGHRDGAVLAMPRADLAEGDVAGAEQREGLNLTARFERVRNLRLLEFSTGETTEQAVRRLRATGRYEFVEPDRIIYARTVPNDPAFGQQWSLNNTGQSGGTVGADIGAPAAWSIQSSASGVIVAVIDSGILLTHTDLIANLWTNPSPGTSGFRNDLHGINATVSHLSSASGNPTDDDSVGHGTHVSGTIGAVGNNGVDISGVAWSVQLMALKFLTADGSGATSDEITCLNYAIAHGAAVINASFGSNLYSQSEFNAIQQAGQAGIIFVAAAGNDSLSTDTGNDYPAGYLLDNIVTVAATTRTDALASYSNYGSGSVDLAAPGDQILSTINTSNTATGVLSGTSMATPHVSGSLALLKAHFPSDTYRQLINRLLRNVTKLPGLSGKVQSGGRINLAQALTSTDNRPMNDDFAARAQLAGPNVRVRASNVGASRETGEPVHGGVTGGASLWWTWTASTTSIVAFDTAGSNFDTVLAIYTGSSLSTLQPIASNDNASASLSTSRVLINVTAGTTYQIAVDGKNGATGTVSLQIGTVPANDNFANAQVVSGVSFVTSGFTSNATAETGEPNPTGASNGLTVWYQWTAPTTGHYVLSAFATQIDAVAAVYTGTAVNKLTTVASNDNSASYNSDSLVPFNATAGTTYYFQISNTDVTGGDFTISLTDALWAFPAGMYNASLSTLPTPDITSSPAVAADGTVYFGSNDSFVYALNADGSIKWDRSTGDIIDMASPALGADGTVYIGSNDGYLYALNGSTGTQKWRFSATTGISSAPAIGSDGTVYFRDDTNLYALTDNGTSATKKWSVALSGGTYCSPAIGTAGTVYVGATGGSFYAVNPNGTTKWTYTANGDIYTSAAIAADGTIYFGTLSGSLYAVTDNGTSATPKWIWNTADGSSITSSPAIGTDGTIYFGGYDHKLHALSPTDGKEKWSYTAADQVRASSPAIAADGTIYFGDYDSQLYAVNPNGTLQRVYSTALLIRSSPVIANNRLYFGSTDGKLYAFNLGQNAASSVWPMFQQNAAHTARAISGAITLVTQPQSQIALVGGTLTLNVAVSGAATGYQWSKNGVAISGATSSTLTVANVTAAAAGSYTVAVTSPTNTVISNAATITVQSPLYGRLIDISVRAVAGSGAQTLIVGFSVTGGNKPVLLRGIGPSLAAYGVAGTLPDPFLALYSGNTVLQTNDNWGNDPAVAAAINAFTGFPLAANSKDAALLRTLPSGPYTAWVTDVTGNSGVALAEVYDADSTPASAQSVAAVSRLTSISARAPVGTGDNVLIAGFAFNGNVPKTLLIRAVGPSLSQFPGLTGLLLNPKLELHTTVNNVDTIVATNAGWGGSTTLSNAFTAVQAFQLNGPTSLDAVLLVTLQPGTYTAEVSGVNGTTGVALIEVYEMP